MGSHSTIDHSNGRVQLLNGRVFYSPNSSRKVHLPPIRNDKGRSENIFLPQVLPESSPNMDQRHRRHRYDFTDPKLNMSWYNEPHWWTFVWGWTSFIPIRPKFYGDIFGCLAKLPSEADLVEIELDDSGIGIKLSENLCLSWSLLEGNLYRACHHLTVLSQTNVVKPLLPWAFGYNKVYKSTKKALSSIHRSRDWFVIWMGLFSYLIALAELKKEELAPYPQLAIADWLHYLGSKDFDPSWLDALTLSPVCSFSPFNERTGIFLDPLKFDDLQPPVEWFIKFSVPIWYPWDKEHKSKSSIQHLAPRYLQVTFSDPIETPQGTTTQATAAPLLSAWETFFLKREERNRKIAAHESDSARRSRLDRERNPPKISAKVFIWERNEYGQLIRELVPKKERAEILDSFSEDQIKYDSFANEYDCYEEFGPGATESAIDYFLAGLPEVDDEEDRDNFRAPEEIEEHCAKIVANSASHPFSPILNDIPADNQVVPTMVDRFEAEILDVLYVYFGFTIPLIPTSPSTELKNEAEQKNVMKILGVSWKLVPKAVFTRPQVKIALDFLRRLCQRKDIQDMEWDFSLNNRQSLHLSGRHRCIRLVKSTAREKKLYYMFDFGESTTTKWKLAMTSAAHAMMVCRLDPAYDEEDIARYLLERGIPFRTFQLSSTLHRSPRKLATISIPQRDENYIFNTNDYSIYIDRCTAILRGPRARAALMRGGYLWRLSSPIVSYDTVTAGPSGWTTKTEEMLVVETGEGQEYIDDELLPYEADLLSGLYICTTGNGKQVAKKSWYPLPYTFEHSGQDYGRWTSNSEAIFAISQSGNLGDKSQVKRQPRSVNQWRDATRGSGDLRRANIRLDEAASNVLKFSTEAL